MVFNTPTTPQAEPLPPSRLFLRSQNSLSCIRELSYATKTKLQRSKSELRGLTIQTDAIKHLQERGYLQESGFAASASRSG